MTRALASLILLAACAHPAAVTSERPAAAPGTVAPAPTGTSTVTELPSCPNILASEALEDGRWKPGSWVPKLNSTASISTSIQVKNGLMLVVGGAEQNFADLDFLLPHEGGYCVVNSWGTAFPGSVVMSISKTWVYATGELAVILVDLEVSTPNGPHSEWLVLATDGQRLWNAVENAKALHLLVPKAELRVAQGQLQLALTNKYVTLLAFDPHKALFVGLK